MIRLIFAVLVAACVQGLAQDAGSGGDDLTIEFLQTQIKRTKSDAELDATVRQEIIKVYEAAIERLEIADEAVAKATKLQQQLAGAEQELMQLQDQLSRLPEKPSLTITESDSVESLERQLAARKLKLDDPEKGLRARSAAADSELSKRMARLEELMNEVAEVDERLAMIKEQMDEPAPADEPSEMTKARQTLLVTRQARAEEERAALQAEQQWCESDVVADLLKARRDLADKEAALVEQEEVVLQTAIDKRRHSAADKRIRQAEQFLERASSPIKGLARQNVTLAQEGRKLTADLHETAENLNSTVDELTSLKEDFERTTTMVEEVGLTESIGLLLRQRRAKLMDQRSLRSSLADRGEVVRQTRLRMFQLEADETALRDLDAAAQQAATEILNGESIAGTSTSGITGAGASASTPKDGTVGSASKAAISKLAAEIKPLLANRQEMIESLQEDYTDYFKQLVQLDIEERRSLDATSKYARYIDERVLWIRTGSLYDTGSVTKAVSVVKTWLIPPTNWKKVGDAILNDLRQRPVPYMIAVGLTILLLGARWSMRSRLRLIGERAASLNCRELAPTLEAVGLTVALAALLPGLLAFFAWRLEHGGSTSRFVHAVSGGLWRAALFAFPMELLRMIVVHGGLAERHFDWAPKFVPRLRHHLRWFVPVGLGLVLLTGMVEMTADEQRLDTLGRLGFLAFAASLALFCQVALPKRSDVPADSGKTGTSGHNGLTGPAASLTNGRRPEVTVVETDVWMNRLARLGGILSVVGPVGLLLLGWCGYFYTALQLTWRWQGTAWLGIGLLLVRAVVLRWITLERRRMAQLQAEELDQISQAGTTPESNEQNPFLFPSWRWPDFRMNLTQIVSQMRRLLDTGVLTLAAIGLWFIWADVTPALNILDRVPLWQTTVEESVTTKDANGAAVVQMMKRPRAITAANLGMALLLMAVAVFAGRNIPGLVEVILLEHLSVDAGVRFAVTCLVRYAIFVTGVCLAFAQVGVGWDNVQWLVAAASVGLGFGLQEIFANFVSGIILLFERPMRVGDVITVGDTTGTVSRIRFRATTIVDGDRKELIVPNKEFITGKLLNWTLSDSVNRVAIKVYVASSNDPERVRLLLQEIATSHPALLKDPAPSAAMEEMNSNGLLFMVRGFLPTLKDRGQTTHDLNVAIHDRFRVEGIELPCPQQEIIVHMGKPHLIHDAHPVPPTHHANVDMSVTRGGI